MTYRVLYIANILITKYIGRDLLILIYAISIVKVIYNKQPWKVSIYSLYIKENANGR